MQRIFLTIFCLLLTHCLAWGAAAVYYVNEEGHLAGFTRVEVNDAAAALKALASPPAASEAGQVLTSAVLPGTTLNALSDAGETTVVDFSGDIIGTGLDDARLETIFEQVRATLVQFGIGGSIRVQAEGQSLSSYLPARPAVEPRPRPQTGPSLAPGVLAGKEISISPGHGLYWSGSSWVTARPVYCSPLSQEDYHNLEIAKYLDTYLAQDGAVVKQYRCFNKSYGTYSPSGHAFWHMAACYWTKEAGYPCSVYASSSGDCTLASGSSESSDAIRAGPVASNYDGTDAHISLHSNGLSGDCTGSTCPNGTITYYDSDAEHASWTLVSSNLAKKVQSALVSAIRTKYTDSTWRDRGIGDAQGGFAETRVPDRPAILIELAFHDTCDRDGLYLQDNFFRSTTMWATYKGICDYFGVTPTWDYYSYEVVTNTLPDVMLPGATVAAQITLRNRGVLWNDTKQFRLGAVGDSDPFTSTTRYNVGSEIGPNTTKAFTITLTAPTTPGTYTTDWRMLRESVTWFGPTVSKNVLVSSTGDTQPPTAPTNLVATPAAYNQINLTWSAATDNVGVTGYRIYRNSALQGTSATTSYSDTSCDSLTTYSHQVSAVDGAGNESALSASVQATTPAKRDFIIDNPDGILTGSWVAGTSSTDKYGTNYNYKSTQPSDTGTFRWTPTIEEAGLYDLFVWYPQGSNRSAEAPYTVVFAGGSVTVAVNQQSGGGAWKKIASSKPFLKGTAGCAQLANGTGENSLNVMADAVRFTYVSAIPAPVITASPQSQTVCQGGTASFSVTVTSAVPPAYQWRKAGAAVSVATTSSLVLAGVTNGNAGSYDVVVTNVSGAATSGVATLTVKLPPGITTQPTNQVAMAGDSVVFTVVATGTAPLSYQWRKGGAPISNATGAALNRSPVTASDAGSYDVVVTNACASATSALVTLTVDLSQVPILFHAFNGSTLTLSWTNADCVLQQATSLTGSPTNWENVPDAISPWNLNIAPTNRAARFFRLRY